MKESENEERKENAQEADMNGGASKEVGRSGRRCDDFPSPLTIYHLRCDVPTPTTYPQFSFSRSPRYPMTDALPIYLCALIDTGHAY